jgi:multiple sugar transport system substrate-binding protein
MRHSVAYAQTDTVPTKPRRIVAAVCLASVLVWAAGCASFIGGRDTAGEGSGVTLRLGFYAPAGGGSEETMQQLAADFEEQNPNIDLKLQSAPYEQFFPRLRTQVAGGTAPDVWLSDGVLVQEFAERGALRDLAPYLESIDESDYLGLDIVSRDGKTYGFPQGIQTPVLFYNKQLFDAAGVAPPTAEWTYEDLASAAKQLTQDTNGDGKPDQWGFRAYSPSFTETWWPIINAFGGQIVDDEASTVTIDSTESRAAMDWMLDAMYGSKFAPDPVTSEALGNPIEFFAAGKVAMAYGIYARNLAATQGGVDFDVAPLPEGPGGRGNVAIVNQWVVNEAATDEQAEAAWKWMTFFASEESQQAWSELGEALPVNRAFAQSEEFLEPTTPPEHKEVFVEAAADADDLGVNAAWSEYAIEIDKALQEAFAQRSSIDEALNTARSKAQAAIDRAAD